MSHLLHKGLSNVRTINCETCGEIYQAHRHNTRFCSHGCRTQHHRSSRMMCEYCLIVQRGYKKIALHHGRNACVRCRGHLEAVSERVENDFIDRETTLRYLLTCYQMDYKDVLRESEKFIETSCSSDTDFRKFYTKRGGATLKLKTQFGVVFQVMAGLTRAIHKLNSKEQANEKNAT